MVIQSSRPMPGSSTPSQFPASTPEPTLPGTPGSAAWAGIHRSQTHCVVTRPPSRIVYRWYSWVERWGRSRAPGHALHTCFNWVSPVVGKSSPTGCGRHGRLCSLAGTCTALPPCFTETLILEPQLRGGRQWRWYAVTLAVPSSHARLAMWLGAGC